MNRSSSSLWNIRIGCRMHMLVHLQVYAWLCLCLCLWLNDCSSHGAVVGTTFARAATEEVHDEATSMYNSSMMAANTTLFRSGSRAMATASTTTNAFTYCVGRDGEDAFAPVEKTPWSIFGVHVGSIACPPSSSSTTFSKPAHGIHWRITAGSDREPSQMWTVPAGLVVPYVGPIEEAAKTGLLSKSALQFMWGPGSMVMTGSESEADGGAGVELIVPSRFLRIVDVNLPEPGASVFVNLTLTSSFVFPVRVNLSGFSTSLFVLVSEVAPQQLNGTQAQAETLADGTQASSASASSTGWRRVVLLNVKGLGNKVTIVGGEVQMVTAGVDTEIEIRGNLLGGSRLAGSSERLLVEGSLMRDSDGDFRDDDEAFYYHYYDFNGTIALEGSSNTLLVHPLSSGNGNGTDTNGINDADPCEMVGIGSSNVCERTNDTVNVTYVLSDVACLSSADDDKENNSKDDAPEVVCPATSSATSFQSANAHTRATMLATTVVAGFFLGSIPWGMQ